MIKPFARSTCPFALGCATETYLTSMDEFSQNSQNWLAVKFEPKSVMIVLGKPKPMQDVGDEVNHPVRSELGDWFELDPFGELVDSHQNVSKTSWRRCEGPDHVEAPASERPGWWYSDESVGRDMSLLAKELTVLTSTYQVLGIRYGGGPPEAGPKRFAN
jgi:hypothetical protein